MRNDWKAAWLRGLMRALLCLAMALAAAFAALTALAWVRGEREGFSALGRAAGQAWREGMKPLLLGPWYTNGSAGVGDMIAEGAVLLLMGLSVGVSLRIGRLSLGAPGQYALGVLSAWGCAVEGYGPWYVCLLAGAAAGALAGTVSGWIRRKARGTDGIADLLLDVMALYGTYAALSRITSGAGKETLIPALSGDGVLSRPVTLAVLIALGLALFLWVAEIRTVTGFHLRLLGASDSAAAGAGVKIPKATVLCLGLSGALAGLAGGCGTLSGMAQGVNALEAGVNGLTAALLSGGHPLGTVLSAGVLSHLRGGCRAMEGYDGGLAAWLMGGALIPACACFLRATHNRRTLRMQAGKEEAP